jgi:hypothetical protein
MSSTFIPFVFTPETINTFLNKKIQINYHDEKRYITPISIINNVLVNCMCHKDERIKKFIIKQIKFIKFYSENESTPTIPSGAGARDAPLRATKSRQPETIPFEEMNKISNVETSQEVLTKGFQIGKTYMLSYNNKMRNILVQEKNGNSKIDVLEYDISDMSQPPLFKTFFIEKCKNVKQVDFLNVSSPKEFEFVKDKEYTFTYKNKTRVVKCLNTSDEHLYAKDDGMYKMFLKRLIENPSEKLPVIEKVNSEPIIETWKTYMLSYNDKMRCILVKSMYPSSNEKLLMNVLEYDISDFNKEALYKTFYVEKCKNVRQIDFVIPEEDKKINYYETQIVEDTKKVLETKTNEKFNEIYPFKIGNKYVVIYCPINEDPSRMIEREITVLKIDHKYLYVSESGIYKTFLLHRCRYIRDCNNEESIIQPHDRLSHPAEIKQEMSHKNPEQLIFLAKNLIKQIDSLRNDLIKFVNSSSS